MSDGSLLQLVAKGEPDLHLIGNPEITFFKSVYKKHTNYSMVNLGIQEITGIPTTLNNLKKDIKIDIKIPRKGDLLHVVYVNIELPKIPDIDVTSTGYQPRFFNSIGHLLINEVKLKIGGQEIDKQTGEWMEIWSQLSYDEAKQLGFKYMVGRVNNNSIQTYDDKPQGPVYLQKPLQFWFCKNIFSSIPLVSLQYHEVVVEVSFNNIDSIISRGLNYHTARILKIGAKYYILSPTLSICEANRKVKLVSTCSYLGDIGSEVSPTPTVNHPQTTDTVYTESYYDETIVDSSNCHCFDKYLGEYVVFKLVNNESVTELPDSIINGSVDIMIYTEPSNITDINTKINNYKKNNFNMNITADYIFLDEYERKKMINSNTNYLIEQVQIKDNFTEIESTHVTKIFDLSEFNFPVKSLYWILKPNLSSTNCTHNLYPFNFSNNLNNTFLEQTDPIKTCMLTFDSIDRTEKHKGEYFRLVQPFQHHTRNSTLFVYMYSFCLKPEDYQPTGSCNFSRLNKVELDLSLNTSTVGTKKFVAFALNHNILQIKNGMGGLLYSN